MLASEVSENLYFLESNSVICIILIREYFVVRERIPYNLRESYILEPRTVHSSRPHRSLELRQLHSLSLRWAFSAFPCGWWKTRSPQISFTPLSSPSAQQKQSTTTDALERDSDGEALVSHHIRCGHGTQRSFDLSANSEGPVKQKLFERGVKQANMRTPGTCIISTKNVRVF